MADASNAPIGVFDSGIGGLTVLAALRKRLPGESTLYLGDTARVPYGTKSPDSVIRYATQAAEHLERRGVKLLVVACNTASALALEALRGHLPIPVVGVVEPGAAAAVEESRDRHHLVLATESTVTGGAYTRAIHALTPDARVEEIPCSLLVALAEEGWTEGPVATATVRTYLEPVITRPDGAERPDTVVLGCTHFPLLQDTIRHVLGPDPRIVDSARTTAEAVASVLASSGGRASTQRSEVKHGILTTDGPCRFARVGSRFLGETLEAGEIETVDL